MKTRNLKRVVFLKIALTALFLISIPSFCAAESPQVAKVEPPNWWAGHSINPVRVLIRGQNLTGAKVEPVGQDLTAGLVSVNGKGTYLFVDVLIDRQAAHGRRALRITTPAGTTEAPFEISAPLDRTGRFQGFTTDDVIYLIMIDRFADGDQSNNDPLSSLGMYDRARKRFYHGGDFQGIINQLPYLKELGVTALWLTPWYDNVNHMNEREQYPEEPGGPLKPVTDYHGYGAVDFYGVEEHFGTLDKLCELVDRAHALGIKIIQDQVANHTGPYHPWVQDPPTPTWYNGTEAQHHRVDIFQTWMLHDPHAVERIKRETLEGWFMNILPDLNQNDEETHRYIIQNALWWIGMTGIDGIRQDAWQYVPNSFWRDWIAAIKREYPRLTVVGEVFDSDAGHCSFYQGGKVRFDGIDTGLDTLFDFPLLYPLRRAFAEGKQLREIAWMLSQDQLYTNPNVLVTLIGNQDLQRFMNEPSASITGLNLAHTLIMTTRGTPQVYYGDDIAMQGTDDPDNRQDFPGGFAGDARNAFTKEGRSTEQQGVFEHLKKLGRLRAGLEPLRRGALVNLFVAEQQYAYARVTDREAVVIVINNDTRPATIELDVGAAGIANGSRLTERLGLVEDVTVNGDRVRVTIPGRAAAILAQ